MFDEEGIKLLIHNQDFAGKLIEYRGYENITQESFNKTLKQMQKVLEDQGLRNRLSAIMHHFMTRLEELQNLRPFQRR